MTFCLGCRGQRALPVATDASAANVSSLVQTGSIPLEGVQGRLDHFASSKGRVYLSALGNDTVEVVDLFKGVVVKTIKGVPNPQGIAYSPESNELFVASEKGSVSIFDGNSYKLIATLGFEGGADNLRYDAATRRVYVACGDDANTGAIAAIDAMTNRRLSESYKLGGEPEAFQIESSGSRMYVNVPGLKQIVVIDRRTKQLTRWALNVGQNFPMALDEENRRILVGTREPAAVSVFDTASGRLVASVPGVQDADDLYYSAERKRVYVPGREGAIWVYQQDDADHYRLISKIATAAGAGTAGYFGRQGKDFDRLYLGVPASANATAEIRVYTLTQ